MLEMNGEKSEHNQQIDKKYQNIQFAEKEKSKKEVYSNEEKKKEEENEYSCQKYISNYFHQQEQEIAK